MKAGFGDCDCCSRRAKMLTQCWAAGGVETWACAACRGVDDDEEETLPDGETKEG